MNLSIALFGLFASLQTPHVTEVTIVNHTSLPKGFAYTDQADEETYYRIFRNSKTNWRVKLVGDTVQVKRYDPWSETPKNVPVPTAKEYPGFIQEREYKAYAGPKVADKVEDGWLYTVDNGEWGGGLYWFSPDWKDQEKLFTGNLNKPFLWNGERYALGGLDHMGLTQGYLVKILKDKDGWSATKICDFESNARFQQVDAQGNLLVVTTQGLYRVSKKGDCEQLLKMRLPFYPGSFAYTKNGTIYLGGTFYLLRLQPEGRGYRPEWMAPVDESPHG